MTQKFNSKLGEAIQRDWFCGRQATKWKAGLDVETVSSAGKGFKQSP
jgi:hypothetical protein